MTTRTTLTLALALSLGVQARASFAQAPPPGPSPSEEGQNGGRPETQDVARQLRDLRARITEKQSDGEGFYQKVPFFLRRGDEGTAQQYWNDGGAAMHDRIITEQQLINLLLDIGREDEAKGLMRELVLVAEKQWRRVGSVRPSTPYDDYRCLPWEGLWSVVRLATLRCNPRLAGMAPARPSPDALLPISYQSEPCLHDTRGRGAYIAIE